MTLRVEPTITAFERSPAEGRGLAQDRRIRWAPEEVGRSYKVRQVSFAATKAAAHRARAISSLPAFTLPFAAQRALLAAVAAT